MENYYTILECQPEVTTKEIKDAYQKLCLKYHPDKNNSEDSASKFIMVNKAYKVLSDSNLREEYNAKWQQNTLAQDWPIQEEVAFDEFEIEEDAESTSLWLYPCRCGSEYVLSKTDVAFKVDYVQCSTCSLCIKVKYEEVNMDNFVLFPT